MGEYDYDTWPTGWEQTPEHSRVWVNTNDQTYHFVDETENFVGPYPTVDAAIAAYTVYIKHL